MNENGNPNTENAVPNAYPPAYEVKIRADNVNVGNGAGLLAFADVVICGEVKVTGFTIRSGENGPFVGRPGKPDKNGKWYDQSYPITKEGKERLDTAILHAYAQYQSEHRGAYIPETPDELQF